MLDLPWFKEVRLSAVYLLKYTFLYAHNSWIGKHWYNTKVQRTGEQKTHGTLDMECIRAPQKRGRYWEIHPRRPRDFPRVNPEGNLSTGSGQGRIDSVKINPALLMIRP